MNMFWASAPYFLAALFSGCASTGAPQEPAPLEKESVAWVLDFDRSAVCDITFFKNGSDNVTCKPVATATAEDKEFYKKSLEKYKIAFPEYKTGLDKSPYPSKAELPSTGYVLEEMQDKACQAWVRNKKMQDKDCEDKPVEESDEEPHKKAPRYRPALEKV